VHGRDTGFVHDCVKFHRLINRLLFVHITRHRTSVKVEDFHRAIAIPATTKSPAATGPMFLVAPPVKPADPADPVFMGATGAIGDPVAAVPKGELALALEPGVPVAIGAVPVANPVDPATTVDLEKGFSNRTKAQTTRQTT